MKNANGDGTIIRLDGKRRKPYAAIITTGSIQIYNDDGEPVGRAKQKRKYLGYYATRPQAQSALIEYRKKHPAYTDEPSDEEPSQIKEKQPVFVPTFEQLNTILVSNHKGRWSVRTKINNDYEFRRCTELYNYRIDEIDYNMLQRNMNWYMKQKKTMSSLRMHKAYLSMLFNEAIKNRYIATNPASFLTYSETKKTKQKEEILPDIIRNIESSTQCRTRGLCLIMIYTGMRIEEILRMKPSDIHLEENYMIGGEKTNAGKNRFIPIHPYIHEIVRSYKEQRKRFCYQRFTELLREDCKTYGMEFTSHYCRHTFITLAKRYHMDETYVKKIVGHSTQDVTDSVYTHLKSNDLYDEICKIPCPKDL